MTRTSQLHMTPDDTPPEPDFTNDEIEQRRWDMATERIEHGEADKLMMDVFEAMNDNDVTDTWEAIQVAHDYLRPTDDEVIEELNGEKL